MKFSFSKPDRCVTGTIGQPGERAFYIQVRSENRIVSVALEKAQVLAIATRLEQMVAEVRKTNPLILIEPLAKDDAPLDTPVDEEFQVGAISLAWDEEEQLMCFELFVVEDDESEVEASVLEVNISHSMAIAFVNSSKALVNAGRTPCPFCGIPIDPRGHLCPRANGYRR
mgnify:FL=1